MNREATVYAAIPFRRTEKSLRISNLNHLIKMSHMESFRFTADRYSFNNNQPNLISFRFVYFVSFIIILQSKFKSGITTNKLTKNKRTCITKVIHFSYFVVQVGEVELRRSRSFNLPGAKIKHKMSCLS
jgi:hypothetical protein